MRGADADRKQSFLPVGNETSEAAAARRRIIDINGTVASHARTCAVHTGRTAAAQFNYRNGFRRHCGVFVSNQTTPGRLSVGVVICRMQRSRRRLYLLSNSENSAARRSLRLGVRSDENLYSGMQRRPARSRCRWRSLRCESPRRPRPTASSELESCMGIGQRENRGNRGKSAVMGTEVTALPWGWGQTTR